MHIVFLLLVESLEVVGLHSVRSEHAHLSLRVLGHEVVVQSVVDFLLLEFLPSLVHLVISAFLLVHQGLVNSLTFLLVVEPLLVVLSLGLLEVVVEIDRLLVEQLVDFPLMVLLHLFLSDLLLTPVSLL